MDKNAITAIKTSDLTREQWLALRKKGIGGSDAAAVCGMNRYKGPLDVYLDKTNPNVEPQEDNEKMYWGRVMEPILRQEFMKRTGMSVVECKYLFTNKEFPFMIADIDGVVTEADGKTKSLLEIKTVNAYSGSAYGNGNLSEAYAIQCFHYLATLPELSRAYLVMLIGGNEFKYEVIERDEATIKTIIAMESKFWNDHVLKKIPPQPDATSGAALDSMYPNSNQTSVILPPSADQLVATIRECKSVEEDLKKTVLEAEHRLKNMLKDAESGRTAKGFCVHWKSTSTSRLDTAKLKAEQPELVEKYTKTTSSRRFSITEPKKV